jgi:hypothetical protein
MTSPNRRDGKDVWHTAGVKGKKATTLDRPTVKTKCTLLYLIGKNIKKYDYTKE